MAEHSDILVTAGVLLLYNVIAALVHRVTTGQRPNLWLLLGPFMIFFSGLVTGIPLHILVAGYLFVSMLHFGWCMYHIARQLLRRAFPEKFE